MTTRRHFLLTAAASGLVATPLAAQQQQPAPQPEAPDISPRVVRIQGNFGPGEIHVDPSSFALYLTLGDGRAIRYAVGIGRAGLYERGQFFVGAKKEWPSWTPTKEMIQRSPGKYAKYADGMPGGPNNPLGARALYLFTKEKGDTFLRIHGTNAPSTIGTAVSNGCVRLVNPHITDLYERVVLGARVVLH